MGHDQTIIIKMQKTLFNIDPKRFDREIKFKAGQQYAVVFASMYGGKGYNTHKTLKGAIKDSEKNRENSHIVIDRDGNRIDF